MNCCTLLNLPSAHSSMTCPGRWHDPSEFIVIFKNVLLTLHVRVCVLALCTFMLTDQVRQLAVDNQSNRVSIESHLKPSSRLCFTLTALAIGKFVIVQCLNESNQNGLRWVQRRRNNRTTKTLANMSFIVCHWPTAQHWYKMSKAVKLKVKRYYDHQLIKLEVTKMVTWPTLEFSLCSAQQEIKICPTYRPQLQVTVYSHRWDTYAVTLFINTAFE